MSGEGFVGGVENNTLDVSKKKKNNPALLQESVGFPVIDSKEGFSPSSNIPALYLVRFLPDPDGRGYQSPCSVL